MFLRMFALLFAWIERRWKGGLTSSELLILYSPGIGEPLRCWVYGNGEWVIDLFSTVLFFFFFFCREFSLEWFKVARSFEFRRSLPLERDVYFSPVSLYIRQVFAVNREVILSYSGWQVCDWIIKSDFWGKVSPRIECSERRRSIRTSGWKVLDAQWKRKKKKKQISL